MLKLKSLSIINCGINDYSFINNIDNLEQLTIINGTIDIKSLNNLINLKYLQLSYSKIILEIQNTRGTSSSMISQLSTNIQIRIASGYDDEIIVIIEAKK